MRKAAFSCGKSVVASVSLLHAFSFGSVECIENKSANARFSNPATYLRNRLVVDLAFDVLV